MLDLSDNPVIETNGHPKLMFEKYMFDNLDSKNYSGWIGWTKMVHSSKTTTSIANTKKIKNTNHKVYNSSHCQKIQNYPQSKMSPEVDKNHKYQYTLTISMISVGRPTLGLVQKSLFSVPFLNQTHSLIILPSQVIIFLLLQKWLLSYQTNLSTQLDHYLVTLVDGDHHCILFS